MARVICPEPGCQLTLQSWTCENISPITIKIQVMPLYGPPQWYDVAMPVCTYQPDSAQEKP